MWNAGAWRDRELVTSRWRLRLECGCAADVNCNWPLPDQIWCERCGMLCAIEEARDRGR